MPNKIKIPQIAEQIANKKKRDVYVIREGENLLWEFKDGYDLLKEFIDADKEKEIYELIFHHKYVPKARTYKQYCELAEWKAKEYGGVWHVIKVGFMKYMEVEANYLKNNECKSLYKSKFYHKVDLKSMFPEMNRRQRREMEREIYG